MLLQRKWLLWQTAPAMQSWIERHGSALVIGIGVIACLVGLFDRGLVFHDEIINTNKALEFVVLDYAMRPVFFLLNILALKLFGNHTYALVMMSTVSVVITSLCLYQISRRYISASMGLMCVVAYVGVNMVRFWGVRAMAHGHGGMFMMVSLYLALLCFDAKSPNRQRWLGLGAGFVAMVSFSTHPTLAGYVVALCSWAGITWLAGFSEKTRHSVITRPLRPMLWIGIGVALSIILLIVIYAIWYHESYFTAWWKFASIPQGTEKDRGFSLYYVTTMLWRAALPSAFLLLSLGIVGIGKSTRTEKHKTIGSSARSFAMYMSLYCLVITVAMTSLNQWKHGRILVSYLPLLALSFAFSAAAAGDVLAGWLPQRLARRLTRIAALVMVIGAMGNIAHYTAKTSKTSFTRRHQGYLAMYEALRNVTDEQVGLLVKRGTLGTQAAFVDSAGLTTVHLAPLDEVLAMTPGELVLHLSEHRVRYVFWDLEEATEEEHERLSANLRSAGGNMLFHWRGLRELWFVDR